jgi:hypothetical protein
VEAFPPQTVANMAWIWVLEAGCNPPLSCNDGARAAARIISAFCWRLSL